MNSVIKRESDEILAMKSVIKHCLFIFATLVLIGCKCEENVTVTESENATYEITSSSTTLDYEQTTLEEIETTTLSSSIDEEETTETAIESSSADDYYNYDDEDEDEEKNDESQDVDQINACELYDVRSDEMF